MRGDGATAHELANKGQIMRFSKTLVTTFGVLATILLVFSEATAEEIRSGLQKGDFVPPFKVVKKGGCDDGVPLDQSLCYR